MSYLESAEGQGRTSLGDLPSPGLGCPARVELLGPPPVVQRIPGLVLSCTHGFYFFFSSLSRGLLRVEFDELKIRGLNAVQGLNETQLSLGPVGSEAPGPVSGDNGCQSPPRVRKEGVTGMG